MELKITNAKNTTINCITLIIKRITDIIISLIGIILLVPITIAVYIANKISKNHGSLFYTQIRIGKKRKPFQNIQI